MPDKAEQFYLVTIARMSTADECDFVAKLSYVISEEDIKKPGNTLLATSAEATEIAVRDAPITNVRPMTEDEIRVWRETDAD